MPVELRHFLLNVHVAGRVLVLRQIAEYEIRPQQGWRRALSKVEVGAA